MTHEQEMPRVVQMILNGETLNDLQACAAKLWLGYEGKGTKAEEAVRKVVQAYWQAPDGEDPYWDFLDNRGNCVSCGERYKLENMSVCPNCFRTYCYREGRDCTCGHRTLG